MNFIYFIVAFIIGFIAGFTIMALIAIGGDK